MMDLQDNLASIGGRTA